MFRQKISDSSESKGQACFYYLARSKTNNSEVVLVHRAQSDHFESFPSLFTLLPTGFLHSTNLYLFDSANACVVVLHLGQPNLDLFEQYQKSTQNLHFRKTNIPYERFFNCKLPVTSPSAENRCDSIEKTPHLVNDVPPTPKQSSSVVLIVGIVILFLFLIICLFVLYFVYKKKKNGKHKAHYVPSIELKKLREVASVKVNGKSRVVDKDGIFVIDAPRECECCLCKNYQIKLYFFHSQ